MTTSDNAVHNEWLESMLGEFLDESGQLLERLNENLLQLDVLVQAACGAEPCCDEALLNEMFRSAHSLKGLSGMLGLTDINALTHRLENVFDAARKEGLPVTGNVVDLMFQAVDQLQKLVEGLKDPAAEPVECAAVIEKIRELLAGHGVERQQKSQADADRALAELTGPPESAPAPAAPAPAAPPLERRDAAPAPSSTSDDDPFAGIEDETSGTEKYVPIFIDDAGLSLDRLAENLLATEKGGTRESLEALLHVAHQLKGSAATVGLKRFAKLAHFMEDLLQDLVDSGGTLSAEANDALLKCTDPLRQYVDNLKHGRKAPDGFSQAARELLAAAPRTARGRGKPAAGNVSGPQAVGISDRLRSCVKAAAPEDVPVLIGQVRFEPQLPMAGLKGQLVYNKLANLGEVCYFDPPQRQLDELDALEQLSFGLVTDKTEETVRAQLRIAGVAEVTLEARAGERPRPQEAPAASRAVESGGPSPDAGAPRPLTAARPREEPDHGEAAAARGRSPSAEAGRVPTETLRVDIEQLDELMNLAGQLVISKARFTQFGDRLKTLRASKRWLQSLGRLTAGLGQLGDEGRGSLDGQSTAVILHSLRRQARRLHNEFQDLRADMQVMESIPDSINELSEAVHQLDRVSNAVQQAVMDTRMVPIGPLFNRFKRVVRDISRANGKEIRLVINGEKTKLDKRMIDELGDPLIHMVRNSADHGIESPAVREAAGKPREGTITLDAFHRGNHVVVQVRDDGAGLNTDRILQKCLDKGLLTEAEAQKMTPHQVHQMIWSPGLSTAEKVTEVSGRGMGMDIVKSKIDLLHGAVDLQSNRGQGTLLSIKLPLTLAIQPSLMVEVGGDVFAMPMEAVIEIVHVSRDRLSTVHGRRTAWVRRRAISIVDLDGLFQAAAGGARPSPDCGDATIVIVGDAASELGLEVDAVLGEQDAVIKSIAENYRNVAGISGASILGDGRISLILDVAALIQMAGARATNAQSLETCA